MRLIVVRYKCEMEGIEFVEHEKIYTSKCDALNIMRKVANDSCINGIDCRGGGPVYAGTKMYLCKKYSHGRKYRKTYVPVKQSH